MFPYIPNGSIEKEEMLKSIGVSSIDALFNDIPDELKLKRRLNIGEPYSEIRLSSYMKELAGKNKNTDDYICFLGAGTYDHFIPSVVNHMAGRSEFYTAYTPYQPEISQGTLQVIFEYQTMICSLTGMDVSNASMYDGGTAAAEAAMIAIENTKRKRIVVSRTVHPDIRKILKTYLRFKNAEYIEAEEADGVTDFEKLRALVDGNTAGVIVQNPNFLGIIEDYSEIEKLVHSNKSLLIMEVNPISLGILKTPGEIGADIAVGEGQSLGNSLSFGGPYLGFMAATSKFTRKIPGRIAGQSEDVDGKRAFVLTLQAREQHIRRQRAASNICSNQALNALRAAIYMSLLGREGIKEAAIQSMQKAHYAHSELIKSGKFKPLFNKPFFNEFVIKGDTKAADVTKILLQNKILGGYEIGNDYSLYMDAMMFAFTEKRTREEIDKLIQVMEGIK